MKKTNLVLFLVVPFILFSCKDSLKAKRENVDDIPPKNEQFELLEGFDYVHLIPDSLRTTEQKELILLLRNVLTDNLAIENNHFVFKLNKAEFLETGIPEPYFTLILNDVRQNNAYIDSIGIKDVNKLLEDAFEKIKTSLK